MLTKILVVLLGVPVALAGLFVILSMVGSLYPELGILGLIS